MAKEPVMHLVGANGQLYVYDDHLEIRRIGVLAKLSHLNGGNTAIDYYELARIKMKPGLFPVSGYMYFERVGKGGEVGLIAAARHPDCIVFRAHENTKAREISKYLKTKKGKGSKQVTFKDSKNNKDTVKMVVEIGIAALILSLL